MINKSDDDYRQSVFVVHELDKQIAAMLADKDRRVKEIKVRFKKTQENIDFELKKLRGG